MHESSLMNSLLSQIQVLARESHARRVISVKVHIGAFAHISAEHFMTHFRMASRGGIASQARVEVVVDEDPKSVLAQEIYLESIDIEQ